MDTVSLVGVIGKTSHKKDPHIRTELFELGGQLNACHPRHFHIQKGEIKGGVLALAKESDKIKGLSRLLKAVHLGVEESFL